MSINRCIDCRNIIQFTTEHFTATLMSSANQETGLDYHIHFRDFENGKFSQLGALYLIMSPKSIEWYKYPQGEFTVLYCLEIYKLIDVCNSEFLAMLERKEAELKCLREKESPWMKGLTIA